MYMPLKILGPKGHSSVWIKCRLLTRFRMRKHELGPTRVVTRVWHFLMIEGRDSRGFCGRQGGGGGGFYWGGCRRTIRDIGLTAQEVVELSIQGGERFEVQHVDEGAAVAPVVQHTHKALLTASDQAGEFLDILLEDVCRKYKYTR